MSEVICLSSRFAIVSSQLNVFNYCYLTLTILFNITHSFLPSRLGLKNTATASLQRGKTPPNECPGYNTKQSGYNTKQLEVPVV